MRKTKTKKKEEREEQAGKEKGGEIWREETTLVPPKEGRRAHVYKLASPKKKRNREKEKQRERKIEREGERDKGSDFPC